MRINMILVALIAIALSSACGEKKRDGQRTPEATESTITTPTTTQDTSVLADNCLSTEGYLDNIPQKFVKTWEELPIEVQTALGDYEDLSDLKENESVKRAMRDNNISFREIREHYKRPEKFFVVDGAILKTCVSKYFRFGDFVTNNKLEYIALDEKLIMLLDALVESLAKDEQIVEAIRRVTPPDRLTEDKNLLVAQAIVITSGFRNAVTNDTAGSPTKYSRHRYGAVDFTINANKATDDIYWDDLDGDGTFSMNDVNMVFVHLTTLAKEQGQKGGFGAYYGNIHAGVGRGHNHRWCKIGGKYYNECMAQDALEIPKAVMACYHLEQEEGMTDSQHTKQKKDCMKKQEKRQRRKEGKKRR